jgi:hypothetical protein
VATNEQIYIVIGIPMLFNATLIGLLMAVNKAQFAAVDEKFKTVGTQLKAINERLGHMQEMWRSELRRVEEVFDARLKHLEER